MAITSLKIVVGMSTGSLGILSEAAHSGLDLVAAAVTYFSVRVSDKPADADHQYGHGKVENFSAFIETGLLLLTCVWIVYEATKRLFFHSVEIEPSVWAFVVMGTSIVVDFWRSRRLKRIADKYDSQALHADALHFSTDIWSSAVVILGLALVMAGARTPVPGWPRPIRSPRSSWPASWCTSVGDWRGRPLTRFWTPLLLVCAPRSSTRCTASTECWKSIAYASGAAAATILPTSPSPCRGT